MFLAVLAGYTAVVMVLLALGLASTYASLNPGLHRGLHIFGLQADQLPAKVAVGIAGASHLPQDGLGIAIDYGFSLFNIALALFLLRLRSDHRTARLLAIGMIGTAAAFNLQAHAVYESLPAGALETLGHNLLQFIAAAAYFFALMTFPDGKLIPRWRPLGLFLLYGGLTVAIALAALQLQASRRVSLIVLFGLLAPVGAVISQGYRYRRAPDEATRAQARLLFWAMVPALLLGLFVVGQSMSTLLSPQLEGRALREVPAGVFRAFQPVFTIIPVALVVGIMRYRLWDVDRLISRALVYGSLAAFVSLVYVGVVVGIGNLLGSQAHNLLLSIAATGIAAAAFGPLRERFQRLANRLVYGRRSSPYEVLSELSERLSDAVETEDLLSRMAQGLVEGSTATRAEIWVRVGNQMLRQAWWPRRTDPDQAVAMPLAGEEPPDFPGGWSFPVRHGGELLGALVVQKPAGETLDRTEEKLVRDLASQAGLVLRNVGLTAELLARLEDLRSSRQRIVAAGNQARRQLERNIHDGAQQQLVALMVRLNLAQMIAAKESPKVQEMLAEIKVEAQDALETLRDLARGIYPPLLASNGLGAALESHGRKMQVSTEVRAEGLGRYEQETEAAVYFCCLEALQNVAKSAHAAQVVISVSSGAGRLRFSVEDDGVGFDTARAKTGSGLQNMTDRMEALGGVITVWSEPGQGTKVSGEVPATEREPAAAPVY